MIAKYIRKLIEEEGKEEVIVPSFGTFIAGYRESQIQGDTLQPPGKKITFYPKLKTDQSDFFKQAVVVDEGISPDQFDELLDDFITKANEELDENKRFEIEGVGTLKVNPEGGLIFEQDTGSSFGGDAFGLPVVERKPVGSEDSTSDSEDKKDSEDADKDSAGIGGFAALASDRSADKDTGQDDGRGNDDDKNDDDRTEEDNSESQEPQYDYSDMTGEEDEEKKKRRSALIAWIIIIPLLFGLAFLAFWFTQQDKLDNLSDNTEVTPIEEISPPPADTQDEETGADDETAADQNAGEDETADTEKEPEAAPDEGTLPGKTGRFYIVRASYKNQENAQAMRQQLISDGYESKMIPYDPEEFHRITLGDYPTKREAYNARLKMVDEYPNSWVVQY